MARFCKFTQAGSTDAVFVNPLAVRSVMGGGDPKQTAIAFDKTHVTYVNGPAEQIIRELDAGLVDR